MRKSTRYRSKHAARIRSSKQHIQKTDVPVQKPGKCQICDELSVCQLVDQGCTDICKY